MQNKLSPLVFIVSVFVISCQKENSHSSADRSDSTGVWVVVHKQVEAFEGIMSNSHFILNAGYHYDTSARTISYRDTAKHDDVDDPFIGEDIMTYDEEGRLINVYSHGEGFLTREATLFYSSDDLLEKIITGNNEILFSWTQQGVNLVGKPTNLNPGNGMDRAFYDIYTVSPGRQLMAISFMSPDQTRQLGYEEVTRDANDDVILKKNYGLENGNIEYMDSIVYTREQSKPPRLSNFYAMLANGIQWFSDHYGVNFVQPPLFYSEFYEFENSLCNKKFHYFTYTDDNGQKVTEGPVVSEFVMEYDSNNNPIRQTYTYHGELVAVLTFRWEKINWVN